MDLLFERVVHDVEEALRGDLLNDKSEMYKLFALVNATRRALTLCLDQLEVRMVHWGRSGQCAGDLQMELDKIAEESSRSVWWPNPRFTGLILPPRVFWPAGVLVPDGVLVIPVKVTVTWRDGSDADFELHAGWLYGSQRRQFVENARKQLYVNTLHSRVHKWIQQTVGEHLDLLSDLTDEEVADGDGEGDDDNVASYLQRREVSMVVVCASDDHMTYLQHASQLRMAWIKAVVLHAQ